MLKALMATIDSCPFNPTSFSTTSKFPEWHQAMSKEFTALMHNGTWSLVPPTPNMNLVGCKWVFRIKCKVDGFVEHPKAYLVAKGFRQQQGVDYDETFIPVVKPITIQTILSLVVSYS